MKKYISIMLAAAISLGMQSFAADINVSQNGGDVTILLNGTESFAQVTFKVENEDGEIRFLDDSYADENGEYSVTYNIGDEDGMFVVTASADSVKTDEKRFMVRSAEIENALINALKTQASSSLPDADAFKEIVENYWLALELDEELFASLADKDEVYAKMVGDSGNKTVKKFDDFKNAFYKAVVLAKYKESENKNDICGILMTSPYVGAFGDDGAFFADRMNDIVDEAMPYITSDMSEDYDNADEFVRDIQFSLLRAAISKSPVWTGVKTVAEKYKNKIGISGSVSNDKYKSITGNVYNSYDAVKKALSSSGGSSGGGSSSSGGSAGGGSKSGGGSVVAMPVNPPATPAATTAKQGNSIFADMDGFKWADEAVTAIYDLGIVNGDGDGNFAPSRGVSRAEAAKMFVLLMKKDISNPPAIPFNDVLKDSWSYPYVAAAYAGNIINGKSADWFEGESGVTRQEFAVMAWNAMKSMGFTDKGRELFADSDEIAGWAKESVEILGNYGIVHGRKVGKGYAFAPNEQINRAEAATIIYNISKLMS